MRSFSLHSCLCVSYCVVLWTFILLGFSWFLLIVLSLNFSAQSCKTSLFTEANLKTKNTSNLIKYQKNNGNGSANPSGLLHERWYSTFAICFLDSFLWSSVKCTLWLGISSVKFCTTSVGGWTSRHRQTVCPSPVLSRPARNG